MRACKHTLQVVITEDMFGEVEVIPPLVIILDKAECSGDIVPTESPPPTQVTPPPTQVTPPLTPGPDKPCTGLQFALFEPNINCFPIANCSGLSCSFVPHDALQTADVVLLVDKCVDPVVATVSITTQSKDILSYYNLTESEEINLGGGQSLSVEMSRNATDLNVAVSMYSYSCSPLHKKCCILFTSKQDGVQLLCLVN